MKKVCASVKDKWKNQNKHGYSLFGCQENHSADNVGLIVYYAAERAVNLFRFRATREIDR